MPILNDDSWVSLGVGNALIRLRDANQTIRVAYAAAPPSAGAANWFPVSSHEGPVTIGSEVEITYIRRAGAVPVAYSVAGETAQIAALVAGEL